MTKPKTPRVSSDGTLECPKCGALGSQAHAPGCKGRKKLVKHEGTIIGGTPRDEYNIRNAIRMTGGEVYVVTYDHRHGDDVWVCATNDGAWKTCADTALEWCDDEIDDAKDRRKIRALYKKGEYRKCACVYSEASGREFFFVEQRKVLP